VELPSIGGALPEKALVIIPTYNESRNIAKLVDEVLSRDPRIEILVVDDASPDGTGGIVDGITAQNKRVHVIHRNRKLGLGTAYVDGFQWALARDYAFMFEMDADFSHNPNRLPEFLAAIENADVVIGSRYLHGQVNVVNWPMSRLFLSYGASIYARAITRIPVADATAGFKCYRRKVLESIDLGEVRSNGYAFQIELNFRAWRKGFRIVEIPIIFIDRTEGKSKMSKRIVWEGFWMVWRLRWWALLRKV
jgi:dolichol-phosphate mannosyltransferase